MNRPTYGGELEPGGDRASGESYKGQISQGAKRQKGEKARYNVPACGQNIRAQGRFNNRVHHPAGVLHSLVSQRPLRMSHRRRPLSRDYVATTDSCIFSRPYLSNGRTIGTVVVRSSVCRLWLSVRL